MSTSPKSAKVIDLRDRFPASSAANADETTVSAQAPASPPAATVEVSAPPPKKGGKPPSHPSGGSGGGNGNNTTSLLSLFSNNNNALVVTGVILAILLFIGINEIGNFYTRMRSNNEISGKVSNVVAEAQTAKSDVVKAEAERDAARLRAEVAQLKAQTEALEKGKVMAQNHAVALSTAECPSSSDGMQFLSNAIAHKLLYPVTVPKGCAVIEVVSPVEVKGYSYTLAYPDISRPGNYFTCGPTQEKKDCTTWLSEVFRQGNNPDKRVIVMGGDITILPIN